MKAILGVVVGGGLVIFAWSLSRISGDAVAMAIGMGLGVLAIVPAVVLVVVAAQRGGQATYYGLDEMHINLCGDDLDGTWLRDWTPVHPAFIVVQDQAAENIAITPYSGNSTRWASPVDGVVLAGGVERERRPVWATEPVSAAIASGGLCIVRADEWDAWRASRAERQSKPF